MDATLIADHIAVIKQHIDDVGTDIILEREVNGNYDVATRTYPDSEDLPDIYVTAFVSPFDAGENSDTSVRKFSVNAYIAPSDLPMGVVPIAGQHIRYGGVRYRIEHPVKSHEAGGIVLIYELNLVGT